MVSECKNKSYARGLCRKHYDKLRNYGDPLYKTRKDRNIILIHDTYAEIVLSNTNNKAIIDIEDLQKIQKYKWHESPEGYVIATINKKNVKLHCFLIGQHKKEMIDHKDRNKLNNKRNNLRCATRIENSINKGIQSNNTSGIVGVSWHKQQKKWYAYITVNKKRISLGLFEDIEKAKKIRISAEKKYFGEYRSNVNDTASNEYTKTGRVCY